MLLLFLVTLAAAADVAPVVAPGLPGVDLVSALGPWGVLLAVLVRGVPVLRFELGPETLRTLAELGKAPGNGPA